VRKFFWRLNRKIKTGPFPLQVAKLSLLTYLVPIAFLPILFFVDQATGGSSAGPDKSRWLTAIIIAPVVETFLFQYLPFKLMQNLKHLKRSFVLYIIASSILFGLEHWYSIRYIIFAFSVGLVLAYTFYLYHMNLLKAFWTTALVHSIRNVAGMIFFLIQQ